MGGWHGDCGVGVVVSPASSELGAERGLDGARNGEEAAAATAAVEWVPCVAVVVVGGVDGGSYALVYCRPAEKRFEKEAIMDVVVVQLVKLVFWNF